MSLLTTDQLAVLALVGSDESYAVSGVPFLVGPDQASPDLQSYPDSLDFLTEYGFAASLAKGLGTDALLSTVNEMSKVQAPLIGKQVNVIDFKNWTLIAEVNAGDRDGNGFGASIFKQTGVDEYLVAMRGTDGTNLKDWNANLDYSVTVWNREKENLFDILFSVQAEGVMPASGTIHFVGQSLGGGLAQYAAYEFVDRLKDPARNAGITYDSTKVTMTTFNSFGGAEGLSRIFKERGGLHADLLVGVQTAHYATANDIVHLLGATKLADGRTVGHLNGEANSYILDFHRPDQSGSTPLADNDAQSYPSLVDAHRIETRFYRGFDIYETDFDSTSRIQKQAYKYLDLGSVQPVAAFFSRLLLGKDAATSTFSAGARVVMGLAAGIALGSPIAVKRLADEIIESGYRAGSYGRFIRFVLNTVNIGAYAIKEVLPSSWVSTLAARVWSGFANLFSISQADKQQAQEGLQVLFAPKGAPIAVAQSASATETDENKMARLELSVGAAIAMERKDQIDVIYSGPKTQRALHEMNAVMHQENFDVVQFSGLLGADGDWQNGLLKYLHDTKIASGATAAATVQLDGALLVAFRGQGERFGEFDLGFKVQTDAALAAFQSDVVQSMLADVHTGAGFTRLAEYEHALADALHDQRYVSIRDLLSKEQRIVAMAAERVLVADRSSDPTLEAFASGAVLNGGTIRERGAKTLVLNLPFAASDAGQQIRITILNDHANVARIITGDDVITPVNGEVVLSVRAGERQKTFSLVLAGDLDIDEDIQISATLLDAAGNAAHDTRIVATLMFDGVDELSDASTIARTIMGDLRPVATGDLDDLGNVISDGTPLSNRQDRLFDSALNDHIVSGGGGDS
ncbi:MAG: Mbeg1-like protein, partial [Acidobacteriota bacterium]